VGQTDYKILELIKKALDKDGAVKKKFYLVALSAELEYSNGDFTHVRGFIVQELNDLRTLYQNTARSVFDEYDRKNLACLSIVLINSVNRVIDTIDD
jgi:hypothetical protein